MLPVITSLEFETQDIVESETVHKTYAWDFDKGDFILEDGKLILLEGIEYIKVWVNKALRTRQGTLIYDNYGSDYQSLIGTVYDKEFVKSEIERMITETLITNDAISNVSDFVFELDGALLNVSFTVKTIYGSTEVSIDG